MVPRFGFDVDGPLVFDNWRLQGFFLFLREGGVACDYEKFVLTGQWFEAIPSFKRPEISSAWRQYVTDRNVQDVPTPGAIAALKLLARAERVIATARTSSERPATLQFLSQHYGDFHECHFELDCKIAVARQVCCFIDDNVGIANSVAEHTSDDTKVILFPAPGRPGRATHRRVITLEADKLVSPDMPKDGWRQVCEMSWQEITAIVQDFRLPA